ncbi:hippurate hydrolase [Humitalea rosea]|uniref:Hippurate hydrolase n=1 Tax=Humitalea rosea TaxID=990373 RepID=A0A2W7IPX5_9PROT|nr:M20 aminoacylase family protein [Humitalea rosea]PZW48144.1 hippurate hydrolase [Humitalea rosea]
MPVPNRLMDLAPEIKAWRRDIHTHPELGFAEHRTSQIVADKLASWGIEVHRGLAGTGVVGVLRGQPGTGTIGFRADMDALAMQEVNGFEHRSQTPGAMHACGHDGHTATLLGAAKYLAETKNFAGTVHFLFQPAEEGGGGGRVMVEEGLFDRFPCDTVYALHNDPALPLGTAACVPGVIMAASDRLKITIKGRGGHAARPHTTLDPVVVGAHVVVALQSIVARRVDPIESSVISLTMFHAGSAMNVIADTAEIQGTVRALSEEVRKQVAALIEQVATNTAAAHGAVAEVEYIWGYPPTTNHVEQTERAARALEDVLGEGRVFRDRPPVMGGEDFSYMLLARPGAFIRLGQASPDGTGSVPVHNTAYDFNDEAAPLGAAWFARLAERELPR